MSSPVVVPDAVGSPGVLVILDVLARSSSGCRLCLRAELSSVLPARCKSCKIKTSNVSFPSYSIVTDSVVVLTHHYHNTSTRLQITANSNCKLAS